MKKITWYACSHCGYRCEHAKKCINCHIPLEKICMVCNNAENNCYFVNCARVAKKKGKTKKKAVKKRK